MRKALDTLYGAALVGACLAMIAIASLVLIQVLGRVIDRAMLMLGMSRIGISVPSLAEIGGFLFVAAAFLALPATLRAAGHVRVTLLLRFFGPLGNRLLAALVLVAAVGLAGFAAWHSTLQTIDAYTAGRVSFGLIRIPIWIPQSVMSLGLILFAVALIDELVAALRGIDPAFRSTERKREDEGSM
jgi:TRAP-type C4-dicarboxylate transport system permease small subunit